MPSTVLTEVDLSSVAIQLKCTHERGHAVRSKLRRQSILLFQGPKYKVLPTTFLTKLINFLFKLVSSKRLRDLLGQCLRLGTLAGYSKSHDCVLEKKYLGRRILNPKTHCFFLHNRLSLGFDFFFVKGGTVDWQCWQCSKLKPHTNSPTHPGMG